MQQSPSRATRAVLFSLLGACAIAPLAPTIADAGPEGRRVHTMHIFSGGTDGATPSWSVVRDAQGNLYGTTVKGGAYNGGTLYKIAPDGSFGVLYAFGKHSSGGAGPMDTPVILADGSLVGSAGRNDGQTGSVIYKISPNGRESELHRFGADDPVGYASFGLTADGSGNLYGTTRQGGSGSCGAAFRLHADGTADLLYAFKGGASDGCRGAGPVTLDAAGNLYGVAGGGEYNTGVVYKITPDGSESVLHTFGNYSQDDGSDAFGPLLLDGAGNLYGTTRSYGVLGGGTVYKIAPDGTETLLHGFGSPDGVFPPGDPVGGVIMDADGNLYGTTLFGGQGNNGVVFKLAPGGRLRILHSFYGPDGAEPISVSFGANGSLIGAAQNCGIKKSGTCQQGTVFELPLR